MRIEPIAGGRRLLLAGFGGLLVLMLVAGGDALLVLRQVRASDTRVRDVYVRAQQGVGPGARGDLSIGDRDARFFARVRS